MFFTYELFLTTLTLVCAIAWSLERWVFGPKRPDDQPCPAWLYHPSDLFPLVAVIWLIRSFVAQPYHVPTGSLMPTILPGDFILVDQSAYGWRLPITHQRLIARNNPQRGDIALFYWPKDPSMVFIKRVIGLPGDHITYAHKKLTINGKAVPLTLTGTSMHHNRLDEIPDTLMLKGHETLANGVRHDIYVEPSVPAAPKQTWVVPAHHYFLMGDNRDGSNDSRYWGFVPDKLLIGQAWRIVLSWNKRAWQQGDWIHLIRWHRLGKKVRT